MNSNPFDHDMTLNGGYLYTRTERLSSRVANQRLTNHTISTLDLKNKKVIDIGCGDGVYTRALSEKCHPRLMIGTDISKKATNYAQDKFGKNGKIEFYYHDIYTLSKKFEDFDIAIVRGVLHHLDQPERAIHEISKITNEIFIIEPNGYNLLLKLIERLSPYHRAHGEKSYLPLIIHKWLKINKFRIVNSAYIGLVPFFAPDWIVTLAKKMELIVENIPVISNVCCAVNCIYGKKEGNN